MGKTIAATVLGSLIIFSPAFSQETFTGVWVVTTHVPEIETADITWTVTEVDGEYVFAGSGGDEAMNNLFGIPTSVEVEFDGTTFTVTSTFQPEGVDEDFVIENSGVIDGDTFEGTSKFGDLGEYRLTGVRQ